MPHYELRKDGEVIGSITVGNDVPVTTALRMLLATSELNDAFKAKDAEIEARREKSHKGSGTHWP